MIRLTDLVNELSEVSETISTVRTDWEFRRRKERAKKKWKEKTGTPGSTWTTHSGTKATRQADGSVKYQRTQIVRYKKDKKTPDGPGKDFGKTWHKLREDGGVGLSLPSGEINGAPKPKKVKTVRKALNREKPND